jgi:hypothetical protein
MEHNFYFILSSACRLAGPLLNTFKDKEQSFSYCSPRQRGQGGLHGLSAPRRPARNTRAEPRMIGGIIFTPKNKKDMLMSFNCRLDRVGACKDRFPTFFGLPRVGPCGPTALWLGTAPGRGRPSDDGAHAQRAAGHASRRLPLAPDNGVRQPLGAGSRQDPGLRPLALTTA